MTPSAVMLALVAGVGAVGVLITVSAWTTPPRSRQPHARRLPHLLATKALVAVVAGVVGVLVTGWLIGALAAGLAGWAAVNVWDGRRTTHRGGEQQRIEALAVWCEQLRDLLSADIGIIGTIDATVATVPAALRPEVSRLSTRLARQAPQLAIRQFASEVDDPSGDLIGSVLLLAMSHSGRTADLLSELASTIRERATMRLRIEAERGGQRAEARFVLGFGIAVIAGVVIFGRGTSFLDAYSSATGQLMLAVVAVLYGAGIWWLRQLVRFDRPARFLRNPDQFGITEGWSGSNPRVGPR
jgi:tight adherence protein B